MTSTGANQAPHVPVLVSDVVAALALLGGETVVDGTFGAGGYTRALLSAGAGRVVGFDRDPDAIEAGGSLVPDPRLTLVNERFSQMDRALAERGIGQVLALQGIAIRVQLTVLDDENGVVHRRVASQLLIAANDFGAVHGLATRPLI